ncbi:MAG: thioesterase [marine bacterium B5-7]|nr:MAG: thioesterase [marine bacterium B5-7]
MLTPSRSLYGYWNEITTRWSDNDCYGHINNSVYYFYIDSVVNRYLIEAAGLNPTSSTTIGLVVESSCRYARSFAYPEPIEAGLRVLRIGNSSVTYEVGMFHQNNDQASVWGGYTHVFVDRESGRPISLPDAFRRAFEAIHSEQSS